MWQGGECALLEQWSQGLLHVEKKGRQDVTLNDRKETQETTNTPQRTVQTRATNERTRVTNEHYEKRCQRRKLLIVSDGAELASAQFFRGIQQETRTSPYKLLSLLAFPRRSILSISYPIYSLQHGHYTKLLQHRSTLHKQEVSHHRVTSYRQTISLKLHSSWDTERSSREKGWKQ